MSNEGTAARKGIVCLPAKKWVGCKKAGALGAPANQANDTGLWFDQLIGPAQFVMSSTSVPIWFGPAAVMPLGPKETIWKVEAL